MTKPNCIFWIPGFNDSYIHADVINTHFPSMGSYDVIELKALDYDQNHETPYNSVDFHNYLDIFLSSIDQHIGKYNGGTKVLYAHSTGYYVACFLLKYTNLSNRIDKLILNDPMVEFEKVFWKEFFMRNMSLHPLNWKFKTVFRFNRFGVIQKAKQSTYKTYLHNLDYLPESTKRMINTNIPPAYSGILVAMTRAQKEIAKTNKVEPYLGNIPTLIFIANGTKDMGSELARSETNRAALVSSNVTTVHLNNCYHDVFFPESTDNFTHMDSVIKVFLENPKQSVEIEQWEPPSTPYDIHNKPLIVANALAIGGIYASYRILSSTLTRLRK